MDTEMTRANMDDLPAYDFPEGYRMRHWQAGDMQLWLDLHIPLFAEGEINEALFHQEYGHDNALHEQRIYFLMHEEQVIGTISAWFGDYGLDKDFGDRSLGRIHWVVIEPDYQGKGLSKPMMAYACHKLKELGHQSAFLFTATELTPAIGLYLKFGFQPVITSDELQAAWDEAYKLVR